MEERSSGFFVDYQRYKSLFENNHDAVCAVDSIGKYVEWNPTFEKLTEYSGSELLDMCFMDLMVPDEIERANDKFKKYFSGEIIEELTFRLKQKTGKSLIITSKLIPIKIDNQMFGFYAIMKDITHQREMENALRKKENLLAHAQRIASIGSWEFDPIQKVSYWSEELFNIYGIENTGNIPLAQVIKYIHPADREHFIQSANALAAGRPYDVEFRIIRSDGEVRVLKSKREMLVTEREISLIGTVQDITEQKHTQELLLKSEKLSVVGQLAAGVAHEIRNSLTALMGFLKLIPTTDNPQRYLDIMANELSRIEAVTRELLVLAKPQKQQFSVIDLGQVLSNVLQLLNTHAIMKSVDVYMEFVEDAIPVQCEANQVEQVFVNLIKNAIEASPTGGRVIVQLNQNKHETVIIKVVALKPRRQVGQTL